MGKYQKTAIFSEAMDTAGQPLETCFARVGANTGNLAFFRGIQKLFRPDFLRPAWGLSANEEKLSQYDAFLTTDLIWIPQNQVYPNTEKILNAIGDRPLIPISVGLQCNSYDADFQMHPDTVRLLKRLEERCVIGVRGNYTAQILSDRGIRNIEVIGCPSVFYREEYRFTEREGEPKTVCNFKTFWGRCRAWEIELLKYFCEKNLPFIEQTRQPVTELKNENCSRFVPWLEKQRHLFFNTAQWDAFLQNYDFSIGMRFHGNVIAMQNGLRALFVVSDSRTRELTEYFGLPVLEAKEFDSKKTLEEYWEMAKPTEFLTRLPVLRKRLESFADKNNLILYETQTCRNIDR